MIIDRRQALKGSLAAAAGLSYCSQAYSAVQLPSTPIKLDRSKLTPAFMEEFDRPLSIWDPKTHKGRWKTNYFYADQFGPSSRIANDDICVDPTYCGVNPFGMWSDTVNLSLSRTGSRDPRLGGKRITAGLLSTERTFVQTYGFFECKFATPSVPGCWPAFWLYSAPTADLTGTQWDNGLGFGRQWTGGLTNEIDVVEVLTNDTGSSYHTASLRNSWNNVAGSGLHATPISKTNRAVSAGTTWMHAYGVLWTANEIVWYVDSNEVFRIANPGIHDPMYMIVSMGSGGWNGNKLASDFVTAQMSVDWVRAYQLA